MMMITRMTKITPAIIRTVVGLIEALLIQGFNGKSQVAHGSEPNQLISGALRLRWNAVPYKTKSEVRDTA
jgi:hypothetical protein